MGGSGCCEAIEIDRDEDNGFHGLSVKNLMLSVSDSKPLFPIYL